MCTCRSVTFTDKATITQDKAGMAENQEKKNKMMKGLKMHLAKQYLMEKEDNFGASDDEQDAVVDKLPPIHQNTLWDSKKINKSKDGGSAVR